MRHWLTVAALAWLLAALVNGTVQRADEARRQWGRTTPVWVADRSLRAGERIYEVPISYRARSRDEGKKLTAVDGLRVLRTLVRCRLR